MAGGGWRSGRRRKVWRESRDHSRRGSPMLLSLSLLVYFSVFFVYILVSIFFKTQLERMSHVDDVSASAFVGLLEIDNF